VRRAGRDNSQGGRVNKLSNPDGKAKPSGRDSHQRPDSLTELDSRIRKRVPARAGSGTNRADQINNKANRTHSLGSRIPNGNPAHRASQRCKVKAASVAPPSRARPRSAKPQRQSQGRGSRIIRNRCRPF
jgi:hypothetical protein